MTANCHWFVVPIRVGAADSSSVIVQFPPVVCSWMPFVAMPSSSLKIAFVTVLGSIT